MTRDDFLEVTIYPRLCTTCETATRLAPKVAALIVPTAALVAATWHALGAAIDRAVCAWPNTTDQEHP